MSDSAYDVILATPASTRQSRSARRTLNIAAPVLVAAGLITLWELWVRVGDVSPLILPAPSSVAARMWDRRDVLMPEAWVTIQEIVVGYSIATVLGLVCAVLIVAIRPIELTIYPILVASQVIPKIAIAPLIFIWFGLGNTSRIVIIVLLSFFPVVIAAVVGLKSVEPSKLYLARSTGAGEFQTFLKIRIPQSMPDTFGGMKLAATPRGRRGDRGRVHLVGRGPRARDLPRDVRPPPGHRARRGRLPRSRRARVLLPGHERRAAADPVARVRSRPQLAA